MHIETHGLLLLFLISDYMLLFLISDYILLFLISDYMYTLFDSLLLTNIFGYNVSVLVTLTESERQHVHYKHL